MQTPKQVALVAGLRAAHENSRAPGTDKRMTLRQIGEALGKNHGVISMWLKGERPPSSEDVASFCTAVGVHGAERDRLISLAKAAAEPDWLTQGVPGADETMQSVLESENDAEEITGWSLSLIPGLLQTGDYARAIVLNENLVRLRVGRRDVLERINPARLVSLIGEAALLNPIGGAGVMAAQLRYLLQVGERPNVDVLVVPTRAGWHPGLVSSFTHYRFPESSKTPNMVYIEHHRTGTFLSGAQHVADYESAIEGIQAVALGPEESAQRIADIATEMELVK